MGEFMSNMRYIHALNTNTCTCPLQAAVVAMKRLLKGGAVPDTWAPNGSSALMLAASADATAALQVRREEQVT
jgi:hypothetical protein